MNKKPNHHRWLTVLGIMLMSSVALADVRDEEQFTFELDSGGRFSIENVNGSIKITGGTGSQLLITAYKKADNREALDEIDIIIDARSDRVSVDTKLPKSGGWFGGSNQGAEVNYEISIPATANLDGISSVNGGIDIRGVFGNIDAETVNGGIDIDDLSADAQLETVNGSVDARIASLTGDQRVEAETVNGRVNLYLPANADATVTADTVNGSINADDFGLEADKGLIGRSLRGTIGDGSARLSADTVNGGVRIRKS